MRITRKSFCLIWKQLFCFHNVVLMISFLLTFSAANAQIWEDFIVWYDGNGADSGHISEVKYKAGSNDVILKDNSSSEDGSDSPYEKFGCTFIGWSLEPENESVITPVLQPGTVWDPVDVPITWMDEHNGFVFYARWECDPDLVQPTLAPTKTMIPEIDPENENYDDPEDFEDINNEYVEIIIPTETPEFLIAPDEFATPVPNDYWDYPAFTPTPSLLIYPNNRGLSVGKDGEEIETDSSEVVELMVYPDTAASALTSLQPATDTDTNEQSKIPVLFSSVGGELTALPETGITTQTGFHRSQMPASISYDPTYMELQIPSLDIISEIVSVESDETGYPIKWLEMDTGLLADSALPGEGFSVLAAHNTLDANTFGPFALIRVLRSGDRLFIRTGQNDLMIFEVYSNEKINEFDYESLYRAGSLYENTITLLTCEDERPEGGYTNRRIVSARKIN